MILQEKKGWDNMLKYALWVDRVTTKKSIGTSHIQLVYGFDAMFPIELIFPIIKLLQDMKEEPNDVNRRMLQIVQLQQEREALIEKANIYKRKIKEIFDKTAKEDTFLVNDMVLRWDEHEDEKGKHEKFDNLWFGPFNISKILGNNTFVLQNL